MMKNKKLVDEFNVSVEDSKTPITSDYEVFSDKELLDELRKRIIESIIDNRVLNNQLAFKYNSDREL